MARLTRHGVVVDEFSIVDFAFSKSFNEAIEKWDGRLPQVSGGAIPFINVQTSGK